MVTGRRTYRRARRLRGLTEVTTKVIVIQMRRIDKVDRVIVFHPALPNLSCQILVQDCPSVRDCIKMTPDPTYSTSSTLYVPPDTAPPTVILSKNFRVEISIIWSPPLPPFFMTCRELSLRSTPHTVLRRQVWEVFQQKKNRKKLKRRTVALDK